MLFLLFHRGGDGFDNSDELIVSEQGCSSVLVQRVDVLLDLDYYLVALAYGAEVGQIVVVVDPVCYARKAGGVGDSYLCGTAQNGFGVKNIVEGNPLYSVSAHHRKECPSTRRQVR